ncbi:MAG: hypothetical protein JW915_09120 [Chitinispirillaceae bacterium]|nr:hypothetical protein [Chitinispirillaceae bacterium]
MRFQFKNTIFISLLFISCAGKIYVTGDQISFEKRPIFYVNSKETSKKVLYGTRFSKGFEGETYGQKEIEAYGETALYIKEHLEKLGYMVSLGDIASIPDSADILVTYEDYWQWDFTKYLKYLRIEFLNTTNKKRVILGEYVAHQGEFHDYPMSKREVPNVIDSIFTRIKKTDMNE